MAHEEKLDWIYKSASSLVDREDYLLGRKVDKSLDQLNTEEQSKKIVLPVPKNHVEHECIPPSIRDFNKIVQAEQVDLSAKLQEDPLVAIKKREEEARRQFLQNPVQLKKLQEALQKKEALKVKHKKSSKRHDKNLDAQIKAKLKNLKAKSSGLSEANKRLKRDKEDTLNTILMHKFNALKGKLSDSSLADILNGKISDESDEDTQKKRKKVEFSESDSEQESKSKKNRRNSDDRVNEKRSRHYKGDSKDTKRDKYKQNKEKDDNTHSDRSHRKKHEDARKLYGQNDSKSKHHRKESSSDNELDKKIMAQLRLLRDQTESQTSNEKQSSSQQQKRIMFPEKPPLNRSRSGKDSSSSEREINKSSDSEEEQSKKRCFGLVTANGTKIALKHSEKHKVADVSKVKKAKEVAKPERKKVNRMTEDEKEKLRKEMMQNAKVRDKEREENVKRYNQKDKYDEEIVSKKYDPDLVRTELLKSAKNSSVEDRIKSKLNSIQRSSNYMNQNFSKR